MHREYSKDLKSNHSAKKEQSTDRKEDSAPVAVNSNSTSKTAVGILTIAVPVYLSSTKDSRKRMVYALLDAQSDASYITKQAAEGMEKTDCHPEKIILSTLNGETAETINRHDGIRIRGANSNQIVTLSAYELDTISCNGEQLPTQDHASK